MRIRVRSWRENVCLQLGKCFFVVEILCYLHRFFLNLKIDLAFSGILFGLGVVATNSTGRLQKKREMKKL